MKRVLVGASLLLGWLAAIAYFVLCVVLVFVKGLPPYMTLPCGAAFAGMYLATRNYWRGE